jgi:hypothetical protein
MTGPGSAVQETNQRATPRFWTESIVLSYSDVAAAKKWWIMAFDCTGTPIPPDWDSPLPSNVALKLPGCEAPTVLLGSRSEGAQSLEHPILFTNKLKAAYEHVRDRGALPSGTIREEYGTELFEITDPEGHVIEICREP